MAGLAVWNAGLTVLLFTHWHRAEWRPVKAGRLGRPPDETFGPLMVVVGDGAAPRVPRPRVPD